MSATSSADIVCARIAKRLADSVGQWRYRMFFPRSAKLQFHDGDPRRVDVQVANRFVADRMGRGLERDLRAAVVHEVGEQVDLNFCITPEAFESQEASAATTKPAPREIVRKAPRRKSSGMTLRHDLASFIVGPSNELAFAAAHNLMDDESHGCRTVFLHGGCGLGKTHLLQGICKQVQKQQPDAQVMYVTGEHFTNEFLAAVRNNRIDAFRKRIRRLDLLAIDDINFIANKQATQREFLHCFDALELRGARVVLANDNHPRQIEQFSEALTSRCVRGMVVQIHEPDSNTRQRIIRSLAQRRGMLVNDAAVQLLAARCIRSIREIEGALTKLYALSQLSPDKHDVIGPILVNRLFSADVQAPPRRVVKFDDVLQGVCRTLCMESERVFSSSRHRDAVLARSVVVHLTRQMTSMSYPEIGAALKRAGHSTVITAAQRVEKQLKDGHVVQNPTNGQLLPLAELVERTRQAIERM